VGAGSNAGPHFYLGLAAWPYACLTGNRGSPKRRSMSSADFMDFAFELARAARSQTLPLWHGGCAVEDKGDGTFDPVTEADRAAELAMRTLIGERFADHGVSGEEFPNEPGGGRYTWSLDPVDGTRSFICGLPTWTTLIALLKESIPLIGIIDAPVLDEIYAGSGDQAWLICRSDRRPIRISGCTRVSDARLSTTDPFLFADPDRFDRLRRSARVTRYGHDAYAYARLAAGSLDLVVESGLKPHDYNALIPVIAGAGGHIGDWNGGDDFAAGQVVAAASRQLYNEAVALLA
jgi:histidinol phosphatase-like enzyme (inositol monophosphatase family)